MVPHSSNLARRAWSGTALTAFVLLGIAPAFGQTTLPESSATKGRIDFEAADLPPATVELELNREIMGDMYGLCDAAVAGVLQSLSDSNKVDASKATELAAERLAAARELILLTKDVVHEVRVRAYEGDSGKELAASSISTRFDKQLSEEKWDRVLKVRDGNESVQVAVKRVEGSLLGVFVMAADGNDLVLANVVCDASPENVKKLTAAATKIGLENGLRDVLDKQLRHLVR